MLSRDQQRALAAYEAVGAVRKNKQEDYKIAVHALGAEILQSGLAAAMSGLERRGRNNEKLSTAERVLLDHLAKAKIPGIGEIDGENVPAKVRALDTDAYILATRETLQFVLWLKRAVQAKFEEGEGNA